jgi:hypothetical protein
VTVLLSFLPHPYCEDCDTPGILSTETSLCKPKTKGFFMVTITSYQPRTDKQGRSFLVLTLTSGVEIIQTSSGGFRAVVRRATIPASFDESTAKLMIGQQMPGQIIRVQSTPYTLTDRKTGEALTFTHRWRFQPEGATVPVETPIMDDVDEELEAA